MNIKRPCLTLFTVAAFGTAETIHSVEGRSKPHAHQERVPMERAVGVQAVAVTSTNMVAVVSYPPPDNWRD